MSTIDIQENALVLYKKYPAKVLQIDEKILIELPSGKTIKVRSKDIILLHPGPIDKLENLEPPEGDVETVWELLEDGNSGMENDFDLLTLAELIFDENSPRAAWGTWKLLEEGLYFDGEIDAIRARSAAEVSETQKQRQAVIEREKAWGAFLERVNSGDYSPEEDMDFLHDVEDLALKRRKSSRVLQALGKKETPEAAYAFLLELGYWDEFVDPYPARFGISLNAPDVPLPPLPEEERTDLTHLEAFAIDDTDNQDPDDALSIDGDWYWVHIADAAAVVLPESEADLEARTRVSTIYLPEKIVPMLPAAAVNTLGLGLHEVSPALSFGVRLDQSGEILDLNLVRSWVRVQRMSYEDVEKNINQEPFLQMYRSGMLYQKKRRRNGALFIDLPEVVIRLKDGRVKIHPMPKLRSRDLVREAMLMAGEAAAKFAIENEIPFPFAVQDPPDSGDNEGLTSIPSGERGNLAENYAMRRSLTRSWVSNQPGTHAGVGLYAYSRVTSPLRRYLDLVSHQQLCAYLKGEPLLDEQTMLERVGSSEAVTGSLRRVESFSRRHWTLVYLLQNPGWEGDGVLVEKHGRRGRFLLPDLAIEIELHLREDLPLNSVRQLRVKGVNLPTLEAFFEILPQDV